MLTHNSRRYVRNAALACLAVVLLVTGCTSKTDPDTYFDPAKDETRVQACIDKLKPMIAEIKRKRLDDGDYVPGSELTIKNTTFRYYQRLVYGYQGLPIYLSWRKLTPEQKEKAFIFFCPIGDDFTNHEEAIKKEVVEIETLFKRKLSYQSQADTISEGLKSRDEWDKIVRDAIPDRRKKLLAAASSHTMTNRYGVRIDTYVMKNGSSVICSTTVHATAGPNMNCDNEP